MDSTTEIIAHFIGVFELSVEEMRLRADYDTFLANRASPDDLPPLPFFDTGPLPDYLLKGFAPDLDFTPPPAEAAPDLASRPELPESPFALEASFPAFLPPLPNLQLPFPLLMAMPRDLVIDLPPPGSVAIVTFQVATLSDDDWFGFETIPHYARPHDVRVAELVDQAEALTVFDLSGAGSGQAPWLHLAATLTDQTGALAQEGPPAEGSLTQVPTGEAVSAIMVNGAAAEEMPLLDDLLPAHFTEEEEGEPAAPEGSTLVTQDGIAEASAGVGTAVSQTTELVAAHTAVNGAAADDLPAIPAGPEIVAGANVTVNQAAISPNWIDAGVIAVQGDVTKLELIEQINVIGGQDWLEFGEALPSTMLNAAQIVREARTPEQEGQAASDAGFVVPSAWAVTRIETDLVAYSWTEQITYLSDNDTAQVTFSGSGFSLGLGENEITNAELLNLLGHAYDLIIVTGDMIEITLLSQINVLYDENFVGGAGDVVADVSAGDNLLFNYASIRSLGLDTYEALSDAFARTIDAFEAGAGTLAALAGNPLLAGVEFPRVLVIEGDLVNVHVARQKNVVSDADDIELALAAYAGVSGATITTGSNVLANLADVATYGLDSTVMAGGEIYSDALIYQANLTADDAPPTGVTMPALASEAVAFLADDMIDAPEALDPAAPPTDVTGGGSHVDVMQTALA